MKWYVYRHEGRGPAELRETIDDDDPDAAYEALLTLALGETADEGIGGSVSDSNDRMKRILPKYSIRSSAGLELYSGRFLTGTEWEHFCNTYGPVLNQAVEQIGSMASNIEWLVTNKATNSAGFARKLKGLLGTMRTKKGFKPYKNCVVFDLSMGSDGAVVRLHLRYKKQSGN